MKKLWRYIKIFLLAYFGICLVWGVFAFLSRFENGKVWFMAIGIVAGVIILKKILKKRKEKQIKEEHEKLNAEALLAIVEYEKGNIPTISVEGFIAEKGEAVYFDLKGVLYLNIHGKVETIGHFILTNKRIIFTAQSRTHQYKYNELMLYKGFDDGLQVQSKKDKSARLYRMSNRYEFRKFYFLFIVFLEESKKGNNSESKGGMSVDVKDLLKMLEK
ncbi:hypothetical protein AAIR98_000630 [Elusimicrobium simillimum]|uniref:hypothetical protein n=1 Tax=Elusimicrobium simillimum TaxID=3143438 RepID=UPI003C6EDB2D